MFDTKIANPFDEVLEFLTSNPSLEDIIALQPSQAIEQRWSELLEINRTGRLSAEEEKELNQFSQVEHFVRMLKVKARKKLAERA